MNRWIRRALISTSIAGALALVPVGVAHAQQPTTSQDAPEHGRHGFGHGPGLLGQALKLESLSTDQRTSIEALVAQRHAATIPVRAADGQVLTVLARQVEQASIDPKALAPAIGAEESAAASASAVERDALTRLHALLTPAQRGELVDRVLADHGGKHGRGPDTGAPGAWQGRGHGAGPALAKLGLTADQKSQIFANLRAGASNTADGGPRDRHAGRGEKRQALESFRGDSFDASAFAHVEKRGERAERLAEAAVPVLTPAQRAILASSLRERVRL